MDKRIRQRRELSYMFHTWDDNMKANNRVDADDDMVVTAVVHYFKTKSEVIQPFKAYFSAIVYAACMEKYFGVNFYEALSDKELMFDTYDFVPYNEDPVVYERILDIIGDIWQYKSIEPSVEYFKQEFLVESDEKIELA